MCHADPSARNWAPQLGKALQGHVLGSFRTPAKAVVPYNAFTVVSHGAGQDGGAGVADLENTVLDIIAQKAKIDRTALDRQTELASLSIDSLDVVEIVFQIEERLNISLPYNANDAPADGAGLKTAGDVVDMVKKHAA
jgi:acyl carrier protein